ncbi:flagellar protein FlaG [Shewanella dokdonensis]|uniref:Flagellar protein FlaG n=1 Tax=Shewanella dokdonensis TaxID=712036 RepID=A0ABX8DG33_9GAMM|nr:flagellar protein FlaG [Shewanella dokdonensis]MCL1073947.1 flagellar protein FlaG [Shewanella dokdonensis]QVK23714.1 flagellar protein FlaG [Shewanella dokdonensis]
MIDLNVSSSNAAITKPDVVQTSPKTKSLTSSELALQKTTETKDSTGTSASSVQDATTPEQLQSVTEQLSHTMDLMRKGLEFRVDDKSGKSVVSVLDMNSGDVIRQIPSEEALKLAEKLSEVADGLLMKTEA